MATKLKADYALQHYQGDLFKNPNVTKVSVRCRLDDQGRPTEEHYLEVGVEDLNVHERQTAKGGGIAKAVPATLALPKTLSKHGPHEIEVVVVETGTYYPAVLWAGDAAPQESFQARPAYGGLSVGTVRYELAGTLGWGVRWLDNPSLFILSNWHVLYGPDGTPGDHIVQPGRYDGGSDPANLIAAFWDGYRDGVIDAAVASVNSPDPTFIQGGMKCEWPEDFAGNYARQAWPASEGRPPYFKCGRSSGYTESTWISTNASGRIKYRDGEVFFEGQLETAHMLLPGDSGSILWQALSLFPGLPRYVPIGLCFATSETRSMHNPLPTVLQRLRMHELL